MAESTLRKTFTTKTPYGGKTKKKKRGRPSSQKKALPIDARQKGVTARVGKGYRRVSPSGSITAHERGLVIKPKTGQGGGKPLGKGRSKLRKRSVS